MPSYAAIQVISSVNRVIATIENINGLCGGLEDVKDLPPAFAGVAKRLPVAEKALRAIKSRLVDRSPAQEPQAEKDSYLLVKQIVEECNTKATKLDEIYSRVVPDDDSPRVDRYREATTASETVEKLMKAVLKYLLEVAKAPLHVVDDAEVGELEEALKEVLKLPPSLVEEKTSGYNFTNAGSGFQANFLGKEGNQNINNGPAPQINGVFHGATHVNTPPIPPTPAKN